MVVQEAVVEPLVTVEVQVDTASRPVDTHTALAHRQWAFRNECNSAQCRGESGSRTWNRNGCEEAEEAIVLVVPVIRQTGTEGRSVAVGGGTTGRSALLCWVSLRPFVGRKVV